MFAGQKKTGSCNSSGNQKNKKIKTTHIILCSSDGIECKWRMKLFFTSIYVVVVVVVNAVAACADAIVGRYLQIYTVTNEAGISKQWIRSCLWVRLNDCICLTSISFERVVVHFIGVQFNRSLFKKRLFTWIAHHANLVWSDARTCTKRTLTHRYRHRHRHWHAHTHWFHFAVKMIFR